MDGKEEQIERMEGSLCGWNRHCCMKIADCSLQHQQLQHQRDRQTDRERERHTDEKRQAPSLIRLPSSLPLKTFISLHCFRMVHRSIDTLISICTSRLSIRPGPWLDPSAFYFAHGPCGGPFALSLFFQPRVPTYIPVPSRLLFSF